MNGIHIYIAICISRRSRSEVRKKKINKICKKKKEIILKFHFIVQHNGTHAAQTLVEFFFF